MIGRRLACLLTFAVLGMPPGLASDCGTVIVPSGVGLGDPQPVDTLDPVLATGTIYEQQTYQMLYRPVVWSNEKHEIDWNLGLASAIDVQDGGATFVVTLKPYVWSDGHPVTADDVLYGWQLIKALGEAYVLYGTGGIPQLVKDVSVTGPHTLVVRLTKTVNPQWFQQSGLGQFYALPRHAWGRFSIAQQQTLQSTPSFYAVVDGPFHLAELHLGRYAVFEPNPLYGGHKAAIKRLIVNFLQGTDPLAALTAGQVDMATLPFTIWDKARHLPGFRAVSIGPTSGYFTIIPNMKNPNAPFLADARVRPAISMAIGQERIIDTVFHGQSLPVRGFVPSALTDYLAPDIKKGHPSLTDDPVRARALLDDAGWRTGPDGIRVKDGKRLAFDILVTAGVEERLETLELVEADLAAAGISVHIKEVQFNQLFARMLGPPAAWDSVFIGWSIPGYPEGNQFFKTGSSSNYERYSNPGMDRLLEAAVDKPGLDELFRVEDLVMAEQPMIFLPEGFHQVLVRPGIEGVTDFVKPNGTWSPEFLRLSGDMACH